MTFDSQAFHLVLTGAGTMLALVAAIGAQGTFVLRQGILGRFVTPIVLICFLSDVLMVGIGVAGFGSLLGAFPWAWEIIRYAGAGFLLWFGVGAARSALRAHSVEFDEGSQGPTTLKAAVLTTLAVTYLNPLAWLDTTVMMGTLAAAQGDPGRWWYYLGACVGSAVWFLLIGYGSRLLRPLFSRPAAWRALDVFTALLMAYLTFSMLTMRLPGS